MGRYSGGGGGSYDPAAVAITGGSITGITDLAVADGGTGSSTATDARTALGAKYDNVSATDKVLGRTTAGAGAIEEITCTAAGRALIDDAAASNQRSTLGLGTIATQAANSVSITGGSITGTTVTATDLKSATTTIAISAATAPTNGQVLTASAGNAASWVTPSGGGSTPTGTGFRHVTSGTEDGAAQLVVNADVDNSAAISASKLDGGTCVLGSDIILTGSGFKSLILNQDSGTVGIKSGTTGSYADIYLIPYGTGNTSNNTVKNDPQPIFFPVQAPNTSIPTYVKGGIYFNTTDNKLMIGGVGGWETITSA